MIMERGTTLRLTCMYPGFPDAVMILEQVTPSAPNLHLTWLPQRYADHAATQILCL